MLSRLSKTLLVVSLIVLGSFLLAKIKVPNGSNSKQLTALLPLEKSIADSVGIYFWGGSLNNPEDGIINAGEKLAKNIGSQNLRIAMSAKSDSDYKGGSCISNFSLRDLAQRQDFQKILSDPSFKTVMITAYDGVSFSDCSTKNYLNPNFYTSANTQKIQQEYADFAKYLATFSGKTFIISNWEGDNDIYCGAAFGASASGCPSSQQNVEGFKKWINARTAGIKSSGAGNVFSAVEFNIVRDLKNRGLPSVLYDVIPNVNADYFSYSSYESINALYSGDDGSQLRADIATIKNVLSASGKNSGNLIIGEFGFDQGSREEIKNKLQIVAGIAADSGVKYSFIWNLLDSGGSFGLYDSGANLTVAGKYFCNLWSGSACKAAPALAPVPAAVAASASVPTSGGKGGLVPCGRLQDDPSTPENETRMCTTCDIFALGSRVINFVLFTMVPAVAVLFYLIGGLMILLSRGSPGLVATGKNFFWNTTIGLLIVFGAWMITNTVLKSLVGDNDISNNWFRIECTSTIQQPPSTQTYTCSSENRCVAASSGTTGKYTTSNCNDECQKTGGTLSITTINLPDATVGQEYNHFITISGGATPYTFYTTSGDAPPGLDLYEDGSIGGVPTTAGQFTFTVEVNDSSTPAQSVTGAIKITVKPAGANLSITTSSLPDGIANQNYSQTLQATGGKTPYAWSKTAGNLPPGLTLSTNGIITGTPTTANTYTLTVKVEDSTTPAKQSATKEVSIKVNTAGALACLFTGINLCQGQPLKLSGGKLVPNTVPACGISRCSQYVPAINDAASKTGISANLLKATMFKESACLVSAANTMVSGGESYGLMQMQVGTANTLRNYCGVTEVITGSWLTNPANAAKSICLAAYFYKSLADGACGYSPRNILAGYSAGPGRCQASRDCANDRSCSGGTVQQWECLYDNPEHTVCNGDNTVIGTASKLNETRYSVVNKLYCVDHPGF